MRVVLKRVFPSGETPRVWLAVGAAASLVLAGAGCGDDTVSQDGRLLVVATTTIVGDVVRNVTGEDAQVEVLLPPGADPHGYQPAPADAALLRRADLVVANGLGLEEALADALRSARRDGVTVVEIGPEVDPRPFGEGPAHPEEADGDDHDDDDHGDLDPHVWQDPLRMAEAAVVVARALDAVEPSSAWADRARAYQEELQSVHEEVEEILSDIPAERRVLVTNHDTLGYFAARYGFEVLGVIVPGGTSLAEPSASDLGALVHTLRDAGARAIFAETIQPNRLARTLRDEVGGDVQVVTLFTDSLGERGSGGETYAAMIVENARRIRDALA